MGGRLQDVLMKLLWTTLLLSSYILASATADDYVEESYNDGHRDKRAFGWGSYRWDGLQPNYVVSEVDDRVKRPFGGLFEHYVPVLTSSAAQYDLDKRQVEDLVDGYEMNKRSGQFEKRPFGGSTHTWGSAYDRYDSQGKRKFMFGKRADEDEKRLFKFGKRDVHDVTEEAMNQEKRKFMFGKRDGDEKRKFMFGKRNDEEKRKFMFGKREEEEKRKFMFGKRDDEEKRKFMFGKRNDEEKRKFMFGKREEEEKRKFMFGKRDDEEKRKFMFGKRDDDGKRKFMFGKRNDDEKRKFMFGKRNDDEKRKFMFGKRDEADIEDLSNNDNDIMKREGTKRKFMFGKRIAGGDDASKRLNEYDKSENDI